MKETKRDVTKLAWSTLSTVGLFHLAYIHPIKLVKVRMQMNPLNKIGLRPNTVSVANSIYYKEGVSGFYRGISASVVRTILYTGTRFMLYNYLMKTIAKRTDATLLMREKMIVGCFTGGFAAFLSTPAHIAFVRMTTDGTLPIMQQRHYQNVIHTIIDIVQHEGFSTLWRGAGPTITKAMIINSIQLSLYSEIKYFLKHNYEYFKEKNQSYKLQMYSSLISTFFLAALVAPIDVTITRLQLMNLTYLSERPYLNTIDCMKKIIQREGFSSLWKGFTPLYIKLMPNTIIALYFVNNFEEYCYTH